MNDRKRSSAPTIITGPLNYFTSTALSGPYSAWLPKTFEAVALTFVVRDASTGTSTAARPRAERSRSSAITVSNGCRSPAGSEISRPASVWRSFSLAARQDAAAHHFGRDGRQLERAFGPAPEVEEDGLAFAGRGAVGARLERAAAGAVDALAVFGQPGAQLFEPLGLLRRNLTVGHRAHIEQQVAIPARATDQHLQAGGVGLDPVLVPAPGPLAAARDRHAGFPRSLVVVGADALLGRVIIGVGGKDLAVAVAGAEVEAVVDDDRWAAAP